MTRRSAFAIAAIALVAGRVTAQQPADTVKLKPVVVTADRIPRDPKLVTSSVETLTAAALAAQGRREVPDALRQVPGMAVVESGSFGSQTSVFLRGGESDYTKVLVNGVPLNQPGGSFNFAGLSTDNVERIEVARGPGSVLYGTDAMTGVVQIITRDRSPNGAVTGTVGFMGGSFGTSDWTANVAAGRAGAGMSLAASRFRTEGTLPYNNESDNTVVDARGHLAREGTGDASLSVRWMDQTYHFPTDGGGNLVDQNQYNRDRGPVLALDAGHPFSGRVEGRVLLSERHDDAGYDNEPDGPADTTGAYLVRTDERTVRRAGDLRANIRVGAATVLTLGAVLEHETYDGTSTCMSQFGDCSSPEIVAQRDTRAWYAQGVGDWGGLSFSIGGRFDDNTRFGQILTYRVGVAYRLAGGTRLRAQGGTGFKEPTFYENYATGYVRGNPDLRGERTGSWEAGIEQPLWGDQVALGVTWFDQRFRDMVDYTFAPPDTNDPNYFNVAAATARGLETTLRLRASAIPGLTATVGYTYLHTEVTQPGLDPDPGAVFAAGQPLLRRPQHSGSAVLDYAMGARGGLGFAAVLVGKRVDQDYSVFPSPRVELPAYARVDVSARWLAIGGHLGVPGVALVARVRNLLDAQYEEVRHFPAPRRAVFVGTEVRLGS
ncbi:MAG TPA: TonB-dependent receptor [Gemmatimonadales bacterium]|nr:TonB-dependent receptor [Gemmatimonadales bacterium]